MLPLNPQAAEQAFVVGAVYRLEHRADRSPASAAHYFAAINDAFDKLPPHVAERFPSPDHLRKYALCQTGHCDQRSIECRSHAEALRVAAFLRPIDEYAVVNVSASTVVMLTARSQSARAMDRQTFGASKDAVLGYIASLVAPAAAVVRAA
jgi:hypothetical protein